MGRYQAYSEYKDSGIAWIGQVPEQWELSQAKHHFVLQRGHDLASDEMVEGEFPVYGSNGQIGTHAEFTTKAPCLTVGRSGSVGEINYITKDFWAHNTSLYVKDFKGSPPRYIYYLLIVLNPKRLSAGSAVGTLDRNNIHTQIIASPSNREAELIANFLDHETTKIDTLIEQQQQLIQLLKEKRQAVISHAVTKGLNPNAPMKDSGVEWLGEVPEHWGIIKGGYIGRLFGSESIAEDHVLDDGDLPFIKVSSLSAKSFAIKEFNWFVSNERARYCSPEINYIVFPKRGAAIFTNKVNVVRELSVIDPNLMGWKIHDIALTEYIAHLLKLRGLTDIADVSTVPQINNKHIEPEKFPIPPITEQREITAFIEREVIRFDLLVEKSESAIALIQERRTALISAAVTGKIDVRHFDSEDRQAPQN